MNIVLNKPDSRSGKGKMGEEPGKLFIGAVSSQVTKEEFQAFFEKFGEVSDIVLMIDKDTNRNRGFGFVTFKDPACATKILSSPTPLKLHGRALDPKPSVQRGQLAPPAERPPQNKSLDKKIFVGGISQSTDEEALKNFFNSNNFAVKEVVLMHDSQTLKSRGFGFVTFHDDATVENVCRQRFFNIDNKTVECKKAEPRGGKNEMGGPGGPGGPGGNFNQMQRGGPHGGGPNMGGGYNQGWNPNSNYGNNQFNQGGNYPQQQGGWGQPQQGPMGGFGQQQPQQQQGGFMPRGGPMQNQGGYGQQYSNGNAVYNQQRPQPQQAGYGYNQQQQQPQQQPPPQQQQQQQQPPPQQQPPQQQQQQGNYGRPNARDEDHPAKSPRFAKPLAGQPQNYNSYANYGQQAPSQQQQQPDGYRNQAPAQTNQGYSQGNYGAQPQGGYPQNAGNMGNYPQEASGYGPQRVNYNQPQTNFNQPQGSGYSADMSGGFTAPPPQQQQQQQQLQQHQQHQQQPQQQNYQPHQDNTQDMYSGGPAAPGNFARGGNNAAVTFHPYRR